MIDYGDVRGIRTGIVHLIIARTRSALRHRNPPNHYDSLLALLRSIRAYLQEFRKRRLSVRNATPDSIRFADGPSELEAVLDAMRQIDRDVLPILREEGDSIALILPTAMEWVGWESMRILDTEEEFKDHVLDLAHAGLDDALLMLLGMLGPHLRQQSDEIDRRMVPLLMGNALGHFERCLNCGDMITAHRLAAIIFSALHFNPDYSLARDRARQRIPYNIGIYREWILACMAEIHLIYPWLDPEALLRRSITLFSSLLGTPGDPLPLRLQFAEKSRAYITQSGQDLLELLAQHFDLRKRRFDPYRCPTVWDFVGVGDHPMVQDFMRRRNHRIPRFQLQFLIEIRDNLVRGSFWS